MKNLSRPGTKHSDKLPIEAQMVSVEDKADANRPLTEPPVIQANPDAISCYRELGELDAQHPGADQHTGPHKPTQPSAALVRTSARSPLAALADRFAMLRAAYADGTLGQVTPTPVRIRQILPYMAGLVIVLVLLAFAAVTTEVVYGQTATALLTGAADDVALAAAIALSLAVNGAAIVAGGWLHKTHPSIVRRHGVKVASITAITVAGVALALGLVIGGFDTLRFDTATGGDAATVADPTADGRPLLTITYTLVLILVALAMAAGHLLLVDAFETHQVELTSQARTFAANSSLAPAAIAALMKTLGEAYLSAIPEAHRHGRQRVDTYNAAFRRTAGPELAELFNDVTYDDSEPIWADDVRALLKEISHHPIPATVTRIA